MALYVHDNVSSSYKGAIKPTKVGLITCLQLSPLFKRAGDAVSLFTENELTAKQYEHLLGHPIAVLPFPSIITLEANEKAPNPNLISYLGHARADKGFEIVSNAIAPILQNWPEAEFFIQCTDTSERNMSSAIKAAVEKVSNYGASVRTEREFLTPIQYNEIFSESGLLLLAYKSEFYASKGSGVALEAMSIGKPMAVSPHTWMSARLEEAGLGEFVMADELVEALVAVVGRYLHDPIKWTTAFSEAAEIWRANYFAKDFFDAFGSYYSKLNKTKGPTC